jgi:hypothetical protein
MPNKIKLPPAKSLEEMWAIIQEINEWRRETEKLMKENAAEADKWLKENEKLQKENRQLIKENEELQKENHQLIKENWRKLGDSDIYSELDEFVDDIIMPNILQKVESLGYGFDRVQKCFQFSDKNIQLIAEADVLLINGDYLMIIKVETMLKTQDIDDHLKRLERIKKCARLPPKNYKFIGCVAATVVDETVRRYAHKKGFYVLEQSGDTVKLDVPDGFVPKTW